MSVNNLAVESWWASAFTEIVALGLVAFAIVLVATAVGIDSTFLAVFVVFAGWLSDLSALNVLACFLAFNLSAAD